MKKTVYFTGVHFQTSQLEQAITTATDKRDDFLKQNEKDIAKIDSEEIIISTWNNGQYVTPTIKLTYYPIK